MANQTGVDGVVTIGGETVAELMSFSVEESVTTIPDNTINSPSVTNKAGRTSWSGTIECNWDESDTTGQGAMTIGAEVAVVLLPEGNTSADVSLTGTAIISGVSKAIADESIISQSFSLTGSGALVVGAVV